LLAASGRQPFETVVFLVEGHSRIFWKLGYEDRPVLVSYTRRRNRYVQACLFSKLLPSGYVEWLARESSARRRRPRPIACEVGSADVRAMKDKVLPPIPTLPPDDD
jgi:hypothetical protein